MLYPLKFEKVFKEKIWGGRKLESLLNMNLPQNINIGESWEVSCHPNGMSVVENGELKGRSLESLLLEYKEKLVGEEVYKKYQNKFPLLIKYLDVNDKLSVQVHPSDKYAPEVEKEFGKSECWYIMDASEDAKLIMGLKKEITKEIFMEKVSNKDFSNLFNEITVKKGDFINVNPGLVHATLEGSVVICEVQQNSDTTYRIYDFDRKVDGQLRPLHLEKASEVINFNEEPQISKEEDRKNIEIENGKKQHLVKTEYFTVDKVKINGSFKKNVSDSFTILSILDGNGKIISSNKEYFISKGDTWFIPSNIRIEIDGHLELLESY